MTEAAQAAQAATPLTDAMAFQCSASLVVHAYFARALERDRARLAAALKSWRNLPDDFIVPSVKQNIDILLRGLGEA